MTAAQPLIRMAEARVSAFFMMRNLFGSFDFRNRCGWPTGSVLGGEVLPTSGGSCCISIVHDCSPFEGPSLALGIERGKMVASLRMVVQKKHAPATWVMAEACFGRPDHWTL